MNYEEIKVGILCDIDTEGSSLNGMLNSVKDIKVVSCNVWNSETGNIIGNSGENVFVVSPAGIDNKAFQMVEEVSAFFPKCELLLILNTLEDTSIEKAMQAGATKILTRPFSREELCEAIYGVFDVYQRKHAIAKKAQNNTIEVLKRGKVVSVFSSKGGVGKTTIAANLAVGLSLRKKRVCLIDLNVTGSGVHLALDLTETEYNILDLARETNRLDYELISGFSAVHKSGVKVITAPDIPQYEDYLSPAVIEKILKIIIPEFEYILLDCPTVLNDLTKKALMISDSIIMITEPDILSIKNVKTSIKALEDMGYKSSNIFLVVNRFSKRSGISLKQIENTLEHPVAAILPTDEKTASLSLNEGVPVIQKRSKLAQKLQDLTQKVDLQGKKRAYKKGEIKEFSLTS